MNTHDDDWEFYDQAYDDYLVIFSKGLVWLAAEDEEGDWWCIRHRNDEDAHDMFTNEPIIEHIENMNFPITCYKVTDHVKLLQAEKEARRAYSDAMWDIQNGR